ncbi:MAG: SH3 domain-containing protein [Clostridia bacterium]|nr:SH3 domain-containing protein [Clostridia bacterium]
MKLLRKLVFALAVFLTLCLGAALGETARVQTPGGAVNVRRNADPSSTVVVKVPNHAMVEVLDAGDEWTKITYDRKTGYMKTEFLLLPENLVGRAVYADEGVLVLREEARENAPIVGAVNDATAVTVDIVADGWLRVFAGETRGYVPTSAFTWQRMEAPEAPAWVNIAGVTAAEVALYSTQSMKGEPDATLPAGTAVTVAWAEGDCCLVLSEAGCGYALCANVCLFGAEDSGEAVGALSPMEAARKAEEALKKAYKAFAKTPMYFTVSAWEKLDGLAAPVYLCTFLNDQDQPLYAALIHAESGKALFTAAYTSFAAPVRAANLLPEGEVALTLSAETLAVGDVVDIAVQAWTENSCQYTLLCNGNIVAQSAAGGHFSAAYRPREAGEYTLRVTVTDENGLAVTAEAIFTADAGLPQADPVPRVYSQMDGSWLEVKYRHSTMDQSGCAVFTLSSALHLMGFTGEETLPENLARTFALCLTEDGTNNERLIREAAEAFGFGTQGALINDQKEIVKKLKSGALFSFSVARGHIALVCGVSEDGTMARIIDSAPSATFERIVNGALYRQTRSGSFRALLSLDDMPGARWYFETDQYGGLEYWLPIEYVARRGVRLIQPE